MKKKNGFTLIELLAVIIILAVIALIATPVILNVVENARRSAFQQSANGYYDAARYLYDELYLNNDRQDLIFTFEDGEQTSSNENYKLQVKGEKPKGGIVYLSEDGQIMVSIHNGKYCATTDGTGKVSISEDINDCSNGITEIPSECFTIVKEQLFDYTDYSNYLLGSIEEWMTKTYNLLDYDRTNPNCPTTIDTLIIPSEVNGQPVEGLRQRSFNRYVSYYGNKYQFIEVSTKNVIIPENVKVLDYASFEQSGLVRAILPSGLQYIGNSAFSSNQLTSIDIPNTVTYLGNTSLANNQLKSVVIPASVKTIGINAFWKNQLISIDIPNSVTTIGHSAFDNNKLTHVTLPNSITSISDYLFRDNQLASIDIPDNITEIGQYAFQNNQLTNIEIPNSVTTIKYGVFYNNQLTSLKLPNSIISIEDYAFENNQLTNIEIPNSVTSIGNYAFRNNQLTSIEIPNSVTTIGGAAFNNNQLPDDQAFIYARNSDGTENKNILVSYGGVKRDNIIIPESITNIGVSAFKDNQLTSIIIPNSVTTIGNSAFSNNQLTNITIPSSTTSIGSSAFANNQFVNADAIIIEGDSTRFDSAWTSIGFPAK